MTPPPSKPPNLAIALGIGGLIPFVGLAAVIVLNQKLPAADAWRALTLYAAVILSFMGGVHWGRAMASDEPSFAHPAYVVSVIPALIAWFAVAFLPPRPASTVMAIGFAALLVYDLATVKRGQFPSWYGPLRIWLTSIVLTSFAVALLATMIRDDAGGRTGRRVDWPASPTKLQETRVDGPPVRNSPQRTPSVFGSAADHTTLSALRAVLSPMAVSIPLAPVNTAL